MGQYTLPALPRPLDPIDPAIGLEDVRKGIIRIVLAYLILLGTLLAMVGLFFYVIWQAREGHSHKAAEEASTVVFAGMLVSGLISLLCLGMIVTGKWRCLMSAPERYQAKWLMFGSILCVVLGPALNLASVLVAADKEQHIRINKAKKDPTVLAEQIEELKKGARALGPRTYTKLVGDFAGMLSTVFFVLFLRAVALCCNDRPRAIMAELYLLFTGVLVAGVAYFFINPVVFLKHPQLLLGLAAGWLLSGLWYFVLIVSTIVCIDNLLSRPRSSLTAAH